MHRQLFRLNVNNLHPIAVMRFSDDLCLFAKLCSMADDNLNVKFLWWNDQPIKRITEARKTPCFCDGDVVTFGNSLVFFSKLKFRFKNGHFYNVFPGNVLQKKFGKHMIKQFHAENTAFFDFLPVLCKLRDLKRNNKRNVKKLFFARKVLFRILCKLITFAAHFRCYVSRELSLQKEGFSQVERLSFTEFHLWSVDSDLTVIQNFLDRCFKRKYTSKRMDIRELLEKADKNLSKVRSVDPDCQLSNIIPKKKETKYQLRNKSAHRPDTKTDTLKNVFRHVTARILHLVYSPENSYGPNFTSTSYKSAF
ncbi:unnamed protein product [Porites evermanni]|uniref:Uncharacterized protein n=1 Tax=Porites evermanni TaxID=104178 RepID=A0ABN8SM58_9CNID|nr:unnamed protein product [Porites evermanni]